MSKALLTLIYLMSIGTYAHITMPDVSPCLSADFTNIECAPAEELRPGVKRSGRDKIISFDQNLY